MVEDLGNNAQVVVELNTPDKDLNEVSTTIVKLLMRIFRLPQGMCCAA